MGVGINMYKRTDNLSESAPRMTSDWDGFKRNQWFEVPLHENDQQYGTLRTGLINIQPDVIGKAHFASCCALERYRRVSVVQFLSHLYRGSELFVIRFIEWPAK